MKMNLKEKILREMIVSEEDEMVKEIISEHLELSNLESVIKIRKLYRKYKDDK